MFDRMTDSSGKLCELVEARGGSRAECSRGLPIDRDSIPPAARGRRGSVLVLVVTILGVLFVTGMAFMATMNFDAEMIMAEKQLGKTQPGVEAIINDVGAVAVESMIPLPGGEVTEELVGATAVSFAEMPGVHNLFAPIEPYWDDFDYKTRVRWVTDIASLGRPRFVGATREAAMRGDP